ncbi:MAG: hypothetical protein GY710_09370 [Desulfobacteraceae bacterium]|nr:hypothetical protein [Desulfobacteraceae bacterium]
MKIVEQDMESFYLALQTVAERDWKQENGVLAENANISGGYFSEILSEKKIPSQKAAERIAVACGYDYKGFIQFGENLIKQQKKITSSEHDPIRQTEIEVKKRKKTVMMDDDVKMILQRYDKMIESLEQDKKDLRADLERERHDHKDVMAVSRQDYIELKAENKELREENKQLLEQQRAMKKKLPQSNQSPKKSQETKAVNQ